MTETHIGNLSTVFSCLAILITVSYLSLNAAMMNPVKSLRTE